MNSRRTEKKQAIVSPPKASLESETTDKATNRGNAPYNGLDEAELTGVEQKNIIDTDKLLNYFIKDVKEGRHDILSKAEGDKRLADVLGIDVSELKDYPPVDNNFSYSFTSNGKKLYETVDFKITKVKRTYGFYREDTGEYYNFTIVKDDYGRFTYKLQPTDWFNLPLFDDEEEGG